MAENNEIKPAEEKKVKVAASAFRTNSKFNTEDAIKNLGTGEALISFQNENILRSFFAIVQLRFIFKKKTFL